MTCCNINIGDLVVYTLTYSLILDSRCIGIVLNIIDENCIVLWTDINSGNKLDAFRIHEHKKSALISLTDSVRMKYLKESRSYGIK